MKKQSIGENQFVHFLRRNGVYLILTVSLVTVAAVLITGIGSGLVQKESSVETPDQPVEQNLTNQPDERTTTTTTTTTTVYSTTTTTRQEVAELYVLPMTNTVQKPFSIDAPVYSETMKDWRIHSGVDFAGKEGQTVKAVTRGTVSSIEEDPLWGCVLTMDHGVGVVSRYCGIKPSVAVGDKLDASAPIGTLDHIPCEGMQQPHLHFEMLVDGVPIDPVEAIALEVRYADTTEE